MFENRGRTGFQAEGDTCEARRWQEAGILRGSESGSEQEEGEE